MYSFLKQSTGSQARAIGPFIDDTDFKTTKTGLTIANTDIKLVINGAASTNKNSGGGTHRVNGVYGITFDSTDTATVGEMHVSVVVAGALPFFCTFVVLEEAVYDSIFAASAALAVTLSSSERNSIADALLDRTDGVETGLTPRNSFRLIAAACAGKLSGAATTSVTIRNAIADSKNRMVATVDTNGNRTAITTDLT